MHVKHNNSNALLNAIKSYGKNNFKKYVLIYCEEHELDRLEKECIKLYKSHFTENGYNISWGGESPMSGRKHSEDTKNLFRQTRKKEKHPLYGKPCSEETKRKISESNKGKKFSDETRKKLKGRIP